MMAIMQEHISDNLAVYYNLDTDFARVANCRKSLSDLREQTLLVRKSINAGNAHVV
jgi:hypothetical protein